MRWWFGGKRAGVTLASIPHHTRTPQPPPASPARGGWGLGSRLAHAVRNGCLTWIRARAPRPGRSRPHGPARRRPRRPSTGACDTDTLERLEAATWEWFGSRRWKKGEEEKWRRPGLERADQGGKWVVGTDETDWRRSSDSAALGPASSAALSSSATMCARSRHVTQIWAARRGLAILRWPPEDRPTRKR